MSNGLLERCLACEADPAGNLERASRGEAVKNRAEKWDNWNRLAALLHREKGKRRER